MDLSNLTADTPLPLLGPHLPTLILATASFYAIQWGSHRYSPRWMSRTWDDMDERTRHNWASHVVCERLILSPAQCHSPPWKLHVRPSALPSPCGEVVQEGLSLIAAMSHALVIVPLTFRCLSSEILSLDPVFGYDPMVGHVLAISSG